MNNNSYHVFLSPEGAAGVPNINADFGRVTVILGANGTGKSRAIGALVDKAGTFARSARDVIRVEGGRAVRIPDSLRLDHSNFQHYETLERAEGTHRQKRISSLAQRVLDALMLLERKEQGLKSAHSDAVMKWKEDGSEGSCPGRGVAPLDALFHMFHQIFPEIDIEFDEGKKQLRVQKNGHVYSPSALSDGEKQVMSMLADIALLGEPNSLILVDEPELNLHPHLACRLWDAVEDRWPDAVFVYATHCLSFAMRANVDKVLVLAPAPEKAIELGEIRDVDPETLRDFLGAIPAIVGAPAAIGVEGTDTSFDTLFYEWVLARPEVKVVALGGCEAVRAATTHTELWDALTAGVKLAGVVDRDYRSDKKLAKLSADGCLPLDFHEAESYLCHPDVICALADKIGTVERVPSPSDVENRIIDFFQANLRGIVAKRMSQRTSISVAVSVPRTVLDHSNDEAQLRKLVEKRAEEEVKKAEECVGRDAALKAVDEELARCRNAVQKRDIDEILRLAPGKELLPRLAKAAGCSDSMEALRAAQKHLKSVNEFDCLKSLRSSLAKNSSRNYFR